MQAFFVVPSDHWNGPLKYADYDAMYAHQQTIWESTRYWLAEQTGYTVCVEGHYVKTPKTSSDLANWVRVPYQPEKILDGCTPKAREAARAGSTAHGTSSHIFNGSPLHNRDITFRGPYPNELGEGGDANSIWEGIVRQDLGISDRPGGIQYSRAIWWAKAIGFGGYAGGRTDASVLLPDGTRGFTNVYGISLVGDWLNRYHALSTGPGDIGAYAPCAWYLYHDGGLKCGLCEADADGTDFHEQLHSMCVDSHNPYISGPNSSMTDAQKWSLITYLLAGNFAYPVDSWTQARIAYVSDPSSPVGLTLPSAHVAVPAGSPLQC